ncbi:MAG: right-handed parallel beta-helix repeat-containing protein, partial [Candidatus Odinarchaeota archaeon]
MFINRKFISILIISSFAITGMLSMQNTVLLHSDRGLIDEPRMSDSSISYSDHSAIHIRNDAELQAADIECGGGDSGTAGDPYVIKGWRIITTNVHGIHINDTTAHFVVRDCWTHTGDGAQSAGIYIKNAADSTATVKNNFVEHNQYGIKIESSTNV